MPASHATKLHLGYTDQERASSPYASFYRPDMAPLAEPVREALLTGGVAHALLPPISEASSLQASGYWPVETGYTQAPKGAMRVFVLTPMPGVTPAMWDWWFAWHGAEAQRYKLWHPRAHVHAAWSDGRSDLNHYVGRTSNVVEFVGAARLDLTIRFVPPATLGFDEARLKAAGETAICARCGLAGTPMETGWLVHHVRPVPGGSEMRSRFWLGGDQVRPRSLSGPLAALIGAAARRLAPLSATQASDLLVHCAQEMSHLATVLPQLHAAFGPAANKT